MHPEGQAMHPEARAFLQRACEVCGRFDREGTGALPVDAWPLVLEELAVQEGSDQAYYLMDHLQGAGEGHFTYVPLMEALGGGSQQPGPPAQPPQDGLKRGASYDPAIDAPLTPPRGRVPDGGAPEQRVVPPELDMDTPSDLPESPLGAGNNGVLPPGPAARPLGDEGRDQLGPLPRGLARGGSPQGGDGASAVSVACHDVEDINEAYWARRASRVQQLFTQWDCNQFSNERFTEQLQALLGPSVDITHEESEFVRLTNKHRAARNMKFALLMTALRRDAQNTLARRLGQLPLSALPSYAGSVAGSAYEPSDAGFSEAASHAAGRSTNQSAPGSRGGRRHFNVAAGAGSRAGPVASGGYPQAQKGGDVGRAPYAQVVPDPDFWSRTGPSTPQQLGPSQQQLQQQRLSQDERWRQRPPTSCGPDQRDDISVAPSDAASVADSQREVFMHRNRNGHGNILTWGDSSRDITPNKKRGGRQQAENADGSTRSVTDASDVWRGQR